MKDTDKVTLTIGQIKELIAESKKTKVNEDVNSWKKADRALNPTKREIVSKAKDFCKQMREKFIVSLTKDFVRNKLSFHSDRPQDAAEQLWDAIQDGESTSTLVHEIYLFDDGSFDD